MIEPKALVRLRAMFELSQADLARYLGYTRETICRWEQSRAEPPPHAAMALNYFAEWMAPGQISMSAASESPDGSQYTITWFDWLPGYAPEGQEYVADPATLAKRLDIN